MELNVLMYEREIQYETVTGVLGVFDNEYIHYAKQKAQEKYPDAEVWYQTYDLNSMEDIEPRRAV